MRVNVMESFVDVEIATKRVFSKCIPARFQVTLHDFILHHVMRICFVKYDPELLCGKIDGFQNLEFGALDIQTQKVYVFLLAEVTFPQNSPKWFASNFVGHVFESRRRRSFEPLCAKRRRHEFKNTRHGAFVASHEVDFT